MPGAKTASGGATRSFASAAASLLALCATARADLRLQLRPELALDAGYNDNLFLDASPAGPLAGQIAGDAVFDLEPRLIGRLTSAGHLVTLSADDLERLTLSHGYLRDFGLRLDYLTRPLWRLRLFATALYERYDATLYSADSFDLAGGEAGATVDVSPVVLSTSYHADVRSYGAPERGGQLDVEQRALAGLHARLHRMVSGELGYGYLHVGSSSNLPPGSPSPALDRHRVDAALWLQPTPTLDLFAAYGVQVQWLPNALQNLTTTAVGARRDLQHTVAASLTLRVLRWLSLFARYDLIVSTSDAPAGVYQRNQIVAGAIVGYLWSTARGVPPPPAPEVPVVVPGRVTFRARAAAGHRVSVVGDWNGWDAAATPLLPAGDDQYKVTVALPPGRHEYALAIDGVTRPPPDAPAYADDGFGGRNGVIVVP
jgi:hypothetical protein